MFRKPALFSLCLAAMSAAADGYVTLTAYDSGGKTSFTDGARWSDGKAPSADKDYLVAVPNRLDAQLRTPDTTDASKTFTFAGRSLTMGTRVGIVGDADVPGYYLSKTVKGTVVTPDLRLVNGVYWLGSEGDHYHNGAIKVLSPESAPFLIESETSGKRRFNFGAAFSGAQGTGLKLGGAPIALNGNNSGYLGSWWLYNGVAVTVQNVNGLGGVRPAYDADAVKFDKGRLVYSGSPNAELGAAQKIGFAVTEKGGELGLTQSLKFTADVTGPGVFTRRDTAAITLDCWGVWSNGGVVHDSPGYLKVRSTTAFAPDCAVVVSNGFICADGLSDAYTFTNRVVFAGGGVSGGAAAASDGTVTHTTLRFEGPLEIERPVRIALYDFPKGAYTRDTLFPLVEIPVAVRAVTAADFVPAFERGALSCNGLPGNPEVVVTTADGVQTVSLRFDPVVYNSSTANPAFLDTAAHWSDGRAAHADVDYVVSGNYDVRQCDNSRATDTYVFPGRSLTLAGGNNSAFYGYVIKQRNATFGDLRVCNRSAISIGGRSGTANEQQNLNGRLTVKSTATGTAGFTFSGSMNRLCVVNATMAGTGSVNYMGDCRYRPTADNSGYTGVCQLNGGASLEFADETNLGGNPASFQAAAVDVAKDGVLRPLASCTLDDSNRGLTVSNGVIEVAAGLELTTKLQLTIRGGSTVRKTGAGTWAVGGTCAKVSPAGTVSVREGVLKAAGAHGVAQAKLVFADGARYAIDCVSDADDPRAALGLVALKDFSIEGASLPVSVTPPAERTAVYGQALFTVAAAQADAVAAKLAVEKPQGYKVELKRTETSVDGVAAVTISAKFSQEGMALIVR